MERKAVRSTNLVSVGYGPNSQVLEIEFKSGCVYQYSNVPEKRFQSLMKALAIGSYFIWEIKPWYACKKVG